MLRVTTQTNFFAQKLESEKQFTELLKSVICEDQDVHFAMIQYGSVGLLVIKHQPNIYQITVSGSISFLQGSDSFCFVLWRALHPPSFFEPLFYAN